MSKDQKQKRLSETLTAAKQENEPRTFVQSGELSDADASAVWSDIPRHYRYIARSRGSLELRLFVAAPHLDPTTGSWSAPGLEGAGKLLTEAIRWPWSDGIKYRNRRRCEVLLRLEKSARPQWVDSASVLVREKKEEFSPQHPVAGYVPQSFWEQQVPDQALFVTRDANHGLSLWRYAPHRGPIGWDHALPEARIIPTPSGLQIDETDLPINHAHPVPRPTPTRKQLWVPDWAKFVVVIPANADAPRRWYFTDRPVVYRRTLTGRVFPDWADGRGARVLGPRIHDDRFWDRVVVSDGVDDYAKRSHVLWTQKEPWAYRLQGTEAASKPTTTVFDGPESEQPPRDNVSSGPQTLIDYDAWYAVRASCTDPSFRSLGSGAARKILSVADDAVRLAHLLARVPKDTLHEHFACGATPEEALQKARVS